jgi:hypothetical protein
MGMSSQLFGLVMVAGAGVLGQPDRPDPGSGCMAGVSFQYPNNDDSIMAFYSTNNLPAACVNNVVYPATMCTPDWPGLNSNTGPDAIMGQWPYLVQGIRDVGINATSLPAFVNSTLMTRATLAMVVADVLSDRIAIASNGTINVTLSAQQLLDCGEWEGGPNWNGDSYQLDTLLQYVVDVGLVEESCYAYNLSAAGACRIKPPTVPGGVVPCPTDQLVCNHTSLAARINCNYTDPWQCEQLAGCCYDYSSTPSSPRCFKPWIGPNPTPPPDQCTVLGFLLRVPLEDWCWRLLYACCCA